MADVTPGAPTRRLVEEIDGAAVRERLSSLERVLERAARRAGRESGPAILVASKYFAPAAVPALVDAGASLLGENRLDALEPKILAAGDRTVSWDYIGELQSRKVGAIARLVQRIHTVASASAVTRLRALAEQGEHVPELLIQVNVAGEDRKGGVAPSALSEMLAGAAGLPVRGLMTMPPLAGTPEDSRRWFAALRDLAERHGLPDLSMGTSQDAVVAAEEGATVVRVGGLLTDDDAWRRFCADLP